MEFNQLKETLLDDGGSVNRDLDVEDFDGDILIDYREKVPKSTMILLGTGGAIGLAVVVSICAFLVLCCCVCMVMIVLAITIPIGVMNYKGNKGDDSQNHDPSYNPSGVYIPSVNENDDVYEYASHVDFTFQQIIGAAGEFKEGDASLGLAAADQESRTNARILLSRTTIQKMYDNPLYEDAVQKIIWNELNMTTFDKIKMWKLGDLKDFLLQQPENEIKDILDGLTSHVIGSVVKLMTNDELGAVAKKINTPNHDNEAGEIGYLGARIQPNSPDDNIDDIMIQIFDGWSYAVGDVILGTNPVSTSEVYLIETMLKTLTTTFETYYNYTDLIPWCVLSHIDDQYEVEVSHPNSTKIWFQSLAGTEGSLKTFGVNVSKLLFYAEKRKEIGNGYSFYFETGQGADFSNGHGNGFDMAVHEANKYSLARILREKSGGGWMVVNDVAGFIGPEIFRTKEQLLRTVLEDMTMGKLSGLTIGSDICTTLHMDVSLDDLEEIQDEVLRISSPGFLMALPTRNDPMLGYLTTAFHDHLRLRHLYDLEIKPKMKSFFVDIGVLNEDGTPTSNFGVPQHVYYKYLEASGDPRFGTMDENTLRDTIYEEAESIIASAEEKNVFVSEQYGEHYWDLDADLQDRIEYLYQDAKKSVWKDFSFDDLPPFTALSKPQDGLIYLQTKSKDREEYILHPSSGEDLDASSLSKVKDQVHLDAGENVILLISDGLNAYAITDDNHIIPFIEELRSLMSLNSRFKLYEKYLVVKYGRVRIGYEVGDEVYSSLGDDIGVIIHLIGERPGTGSHPFSAYLCLENGNEWSQMDHHLARVVAGISDSAGTSPREAASKVMLDLDEMWEEDNIDRRVF